MKQNTFKKIMSAVLSVAMMFSLMVLPANAVVPGEDSFSGQEDGYIRVDVKNQSTEFIPKSDIPEFTGEGTYDALQPVDRARMEAINAEIAAKYAQSTSPTAIKDGSYQYVSPITDRYSGIVILGIFSNDTYEECIGWGTGFMVDEDTMMTCLHNFYDFKKTDKTQFNLTTYNRYVRIYSDIERDFFSNSSDYNQAAKDYLEQVEEYVSYEIFYYSSLINGTETDDREYDWALVQLATPLSDVEYFWNCTAYKTTMNDNTFYIVGYPKSFALKMIETSGKRLSSIVEDSKLLYTSNQVEVGMSGGPIYTSTLTGLKCCGIISHGNTTNGTLLGAEMYDDLVDVIASRINE